MERLDFSKRDKKDKPNNKIEINQRCGCSIPNKRERKPIKELKYLASACGFLVSIPKLSILSLLYQ